MRAYTMFVLSFLLGSICLSGCVEDDVGVRCQLSDWDPKSEETTTLLGLQAIECESRVCIAYRGGRSINDGVQTGPRCTKPCESDADCPQNAISGCTKFVCRIGSSVTGASCCKFCVCDDDANNDDQEKNICANKPAKCPNI
jgi:hypothetical protein